jgi:hypothetical protein
MEIKRTTTVAPKSVRLDTLKLRLPIEDFTTRTVGDHHRYSEYGWSITSDYLQCFKEEISCRFRINFNSEINSYDAKYGDLLCPRSYGLSIDGFEYNETKVFYCNVWLENENGEKFWQDTCKLYVR